MNVRAARSNQVLGFLVSRVAVLMLSFRLLGRMSFFQCGYVINNLLEILFSFTRKWSLCSPKLWRRLVNTFVACSRVPARLKTQRTMYTAFKKAEITGACITNIRKRSFAYTYGQCSVRTVVLLSTRGLRMTVAKIVDMSLRDLAKKWGARHRLCSHTRSSTTTTKDLWDESSTRSYMWQA